MLYLIVFSCLFAITLGDEADTGRDCEKGEKGEEPGIRYYFDSDGTTYPYFYKGCGGEEYRHYKTRDDVPVLLDGTYCPGRGAVGNCRIWDEDGKETKCPPGSYCIQGAFIGTCCDEAIEARYNANKARPKCPETAYKEGKGKDDFLFGKNCTHNFCPSEYQCEQGEYVAYCCPKKTEEYVELDGYN